MSPISLLRNLPRIPLTYVPKRIGSTSNKVGAVVYVKGFYPNERKEIFIPSMRVIIDGEKIFPAQEPGDYRHLGYIEVPKPHRFVQVQLSQKEVEFIKSLDKEIRTLEEAKNFNQSFLTMAIDNLWNKSESK